jgi:hypothetical protein
MVGLFFSGCVYAPDLLDEDHLSMGVVIDRVRCELWQTYQIEKYKPDEKFNERLVSYTAAAKKAMAADGLTGDQLNDPRELKKYQRVAYDLDSLNVQYKKGNFLNTLAAAFVLTLQVKDSGGVGNNAASAAWGAIPITFGAFSIKATGGINGSAKKTATYKVSLYLREVKDWKGHHKCVGLLGDGHARQSTIRLDGDFGAGRWLQRAIDTAFETETVNHFTSTGTALQFTLTPSIGVTPTWSIVRPSGRKFDGAFTFNFQRDYDNTLDIAISAIAEPSGPTKVSVVNWPKSFGSAEIFSGRSVNGTSSKDPLSKTIRGTVDPNTQQRLDSTLQDLRLNRVIPFGQ